MCACFYAKHGIKVHLFEQRPGLSVTVAGQVFDSLSSCVDIRTQKFVKGRSINLALSRRGREALAYVGCEKLVLEMGIAMHSRMIHEIDGQTHVLPYGFNSDHVSKGSIPE